MRLLHGLKRKKRRADCNNVSISKISFLKLWREICAMIVDRLERPLSSKVDLSDEQLFKKLFIGYFAPLCVFAQKYVGNFNDEDVVSSVFSTMYQKKLTFDSQDE